MHLTMKATVQAYPTFDNSTPLVLEHQGSLIFTFPLSFCEFLSPQSTDFNERNIILGDDNHWQLWITKTRLR